MIVSSDFFGEILFFSQFDILSYADAPYFQNKPVYYVNNISDQCENNEKLIRLDLHILHNDIFYLWDSKE